MELLLLQTILWVSSHKQGHSISAACNSSQSVLSGTMCAQLKNAMQPHRQTTSHHAMSMVQRRLMFSHVPLHASSLVELLLNRSAR